MSVLTLQYPEEFPEHVVCGDAFKCASLHSASPNNGRATPAFGVVTMEDAGQPEASIVLSLIASKELAEAATISTPTTISHSGVSSTSAPKTAYYTTEDGGQSEGATLTSAYAASILANLDEAPSSTLNRTTGRYARQCVEGPTCCC